ncbi:MAG: hypothetical protein F6J98_22870 [Moorea sp. SIO4G2]|nr:hypothetical protein [Moorena sp. SIO4G2]
MGRWGDGEIGGKGSYTFDRNLISLDFAAVVGNREQGTGNSGEELTQTLSEKYFCKRSTVSLYPFNDAGK